MTAAEGWECQFLNLQHFVQKLCLVCYFWLMKLWSLIAYVGKIATIFETISYFHGAVLFQFCLLHSCQITKNHVRDNHYIVATIHLLSIWQSLPVRQCSAQRAKLLSEPGTAATTCKSYLWVRFLFNFGSKSSHVCNFPSSVETSREVLNIYITFHYK